MWDHSREVELGALNADQTLEKEEEGEREMNSQEFIELIKSMFG